MPFVVKNEWRKAEDQPSDVYDAELAAPPYTVKNIVAQHRETPLDETLFLPKFEVSSAGAVDACGLCWCTVTSS